MAMPWGAVAQMIIKASDNINRGTENASKAGEGSNGQNYQSNAGKNANEAVNKVVDELKNNESNTETETAADAGKTAGEAIKGPVDNITPSIGGGGHGGLDIGSNIDSQIGEDEVSSDERLKRIFGEDCPIECFSKIDAIMFEYNNKAKEVHPDGENGVDNDPHFGVKAQDLAKNPLTASAVSKDAEGYLQVNPDELTMTNTAIISELCKHMKVVEKLLGIKVD